MLGACHTAARCLPQPLIAGFVLYAMMSSEAPVFMRVYRALSARESHYSDAVKAFVESLLTRDVNNRPAVQCASFWEFVVANAVVQVIINDGCF